MTHDFPALGLILLFPLLGVIFNIFFGQRCGRRVVNFIAPAAIFLAFAAALAAFATLLGMPRGAALGFDLWPWIEAGRFHFDIAFRFDALSGVMVLVVTGVGALIHLYSDGYMGEDEDYARFFAYMNLFAFAMLILVLANNLLLMFVGWEGVGLCSYLLIAFWYDNAEFAYNGRKAFIVNRVGDAGFVLGILTLISALASSGIWTLTFTEMAKHRETLAPVATLAGSLLFLGATGKSAQIPLYVWLPDAMVGPSPVSALIHAATMVTAGVYMVARLNFLYMLAPDAMAVVATVGALTAFFAGTIAIVQPDIKRVLAYSTVSQLGYMFLGVGSGAFASGIFHLMTHAFFKSLLFLGAGSVIHAMHRAYHATHRAEDPQDMRNMGGLRHALPWTWVLMWIATLAIAGVPPLAGFFSKDAILAAAFAQGAVRPVWYAYWGLGMAAALLTAFYMTRLMLYTFHGPNRTGEAERAYLREAPPVMTGPVALLGALTVAGGALDVPPLFGGGARLARWLAPVTAAAARWAP